MRRGQKPSFLGFDGKFVGICLGADYVAEHEWGLKELNQMFGIPGPDSNVFGLVRRTITKLPQGYVSFLNIKEPMLLALRYAYELATDDGKKRVQEHYSKDNNELRLCKAFGKYPAEELAGAWSGGDFGIKVSKQHVDKLKEIDEAFQRKDIAIFNGRGGIFENAGLMIVIASRVPEEGKKLMLEGDMNTFNLKKAAQETGIETFLKLAGKQWYALAPSWAKDIKSTKDGEIKTEYPVLFWLNPMQQQENNFGYFTVEQLKLWANNEGPIPIKK